VLQSQPSAPGSPKRGERGKKTQPAAISNLIRRPAPWLCDCSRPVSSPVCAAIATMILRPFRWIGLGLALLATGFGAPAAAPTSDAPRSVADLQSRIAAHLDQPRFRNALWGVEIVSLDTGRTLFERDAHRLLSPASNCKLYTAALVLDRFGPDYRIRTPIGATAAPDAQGVVAGDLIVSGRGDPSWDSRRAKKDFWEVFAPFIDVLTRAGVRHITGSIVADATFVKMAPNGAGWTADDLEDYYGAEISAVSLNDNYAELWVSPGATVGAPAQAALREPLTGLQVDNRAVTVAKDAARHVEIRRFVGESVVHVFGQVPLGSAPDEEDVAVPRPADWFARGLKAALERRGIKVDGGTRSVAWLEAAAPPATAPLGEITSPPLRDLLVAVLKPSQNLEADLLFAQVGEATRTPATPVGSSSEDLAVGALGQFLRAHALPASEVKFEEGSGLSRNNLASAHATATLLRYMAAQPAGADFAAALPIAGVDGTLRMRMKGTLAEGNVRAKTGSLRWANSLSGYVTSAAGERLAFSVMLNRYVHDPDHRVRDELDTVAVLLARLAVRSESRTPSPAP
jgi:serine-type D-Ala-D-Ala carboxypeptidase/endopeptidase (penicillin-binding protein 4)